MSLFDCFIDFLFTLGKDPLVSPEAVPFLKGAFRLSLVISFVIVFILPLAYGFLLDCFGLVRRFISYLRSALLLTNHDKTTKSR